MKSTLDEPERSAPEHRRSDIWLEEALTQLARCAEQALPDFRCAILLLENERLRHVAAPSLPAWYTRATDGFEVAPGVAACGAAAFKRERMVVEDISSHPNWARYRELTQRAGLRACWSEPLMDGERAVGAITIYASRTHAPSPKELSLTATIRRMAEITIAHQRVGDGLIDHAARFREIAENVNEVFWLFDRDTRELLYVSPSYERLWGRTCKSLYDDPGSWLATIHPADRARVEDAVRTSMKTGTLEVEYRIERSDGSVRWLRDRCFPIGEGDDFSRIAGISVDITSTKERELSLRQSETVFRQLAENVGAVFWLTDWHDRIVLYVSPNWESIWGASVDVLHDDDDAKAWARNIHPDDRARVIASFDAKAATGDYAEDFRVVHPDGTVRWLHERAFPIPDEDGKIYRIAGIAEDITQRKEAEAGLARARDEIEELRRQQVESLTSELLLAEETERKLLAQELHDGMNQLITLALLKLAQLRDSTTDELRDLAAEVESVIEKAGHAARALTNQLSPPILHDLGFGPALQWLAEDVQRAHGLRVVLRGADEPTPLDERVRVLLFRAVRELLLNVGRHAEARSAGVRLQRLGDKLEILVEDDGVTFDPNIVGQRGVGLYAIRERLSHLGGEMRIESGSDSGTRIRLIAPIASNAEQE